MNKPIILKVADLIGNPNAISAEDGQKVFEKIKVFINDDKKVTLSFERVKILISLFLNVAIGQLYGFFSEEEIREKLQVADLAGDDLELLKRVVDNAKRYYSDPKPYDEAWSQVGEGNE